MNAAILGFLRTHGEELDADIAKALHLPMAFVRSEVAELSTAGEVVCCRVTRYRNGKKTEGVSCRLSRGPPPLVTSSKSSVNRFADPDKNRA